jgi:dienelactone hydrolase
VPQSGCVPSGTTSLRPTSYAGETASTLEEGFALKDHRIGWAAIEQRAHHAVRDLPADTVLAGISMGAGVVHTLLPHRPDAAGVLLLHGLAAIPTTARDGLPVQLHVADTDAFAPPPRLPHGWTPQPVPVPTRTCSPTST